MIRRFVACRAAWLGSIAGILLAAPGFSVELPLPPFSIPSQSLRLSLKTFAEQSGLQVVYYTSAVPDQIANAVVGRFDAREALTRLLSGTQLTFELVNERTVAIRSTANPQPGGDVPTGDARPSSSGAPSSASGARAPDSMGPQNVATEIVVTGTRQGGRAVFESLAPIQSLSYQQLADASGNPSLSSIIAAIVPSFAVQAYGVDQSNLTLQAKLRGLSPNHVLVLIDGKRRHTTANLEVLPGPYQGGAGADLNFIPLSSIDHIEVLTDSAAAQYGTDAIAGVINIILKKNSSGGGIFGTHGGYFDGGGTTEDAAVNVGFEPNEVGFLNLTGELHEHGPSNRGATDPRVVDPANVNPADGATYPNTNMPNAPGYPYLNQTEGDAGFHVRIATLNSGFHLGNSAEIYVFGTYGTKNAASYENYRLPNLVSYTSPTSGITTYPFPFGFDPQEAINEVDFALTAGIKGTLSAWHWDLSSTYGGDRIDLYTLNSANAALFTASDASPTNFYDGKFKSTQWTTTLDFNRDVVIGALGSVNMAYGLESRRETYRIGAGTPASYVDGGAQSYPGFTPMDAGIQSRQNYAGYIDLAAGPIHGLSLDAAARHEHFSDFGNANVAKLSLRYDLMPAFALRGSASTGFRAPTLAEEFYSATTVTPSQAIVELPPNAPAARLLGLGNGLQPEKSTNLSTGFVLRPFPSLTATLDLFQININKRIVATGELIGANHGQVVSPSVVQAIEASGNIVDAAVVTSGLTAVSLFTNGVDTRTSGLDLVIDYATSQTWGSVNWSVGTTLSDTVVTGQQTNPVQLGSNVLLDQLAISDLTTANPKYVIKLGAKWTLNRMSVNLRESIYGPSSEYFSDFGDGPTGKPVYYPTTINVTPITNLDIGYQIFKGLTLSIGAVNLLNRYPTEYSSTLLKTFRSADDYNAVRIYPAFSPFGINGGYYYAKASYFF
jgi:iron complex outermembrane recepter protein